MRALWPLRVLRPGGSGRLSGALSLHGRPVGVAGGPLAQWRGLLTTRSKKNYDMRRVDITPLEQRKLTFDTHSVVQDLESHGFEKAQAETIVLALIILSNVSLDTIYKEMVTRAQQEITVQQIMAHLDSIRKDMVILEKSEFANLRAENELETTRSRANNKLDINLERSRVTDLFTDQEKKLMEATTEFNKKDTHIKNIISQTSNKIDIEIASLKTLMESNKLETIRYLAAPLARSCLMQLANSHQPLQPMFRETICFYLPGNSTGILPLLEIIAALQYHHQQEQGCFLIHLKIFAFV
ncbi:coiled-coil domain-containing protein 90B, mitochondrial-like isoform X2 [Vombatus ursinus]|uniref:coiled-coil domain-containing protein 90B, mitochondrial-like isoform X2 n=1 Tax=Vombatus ursinus TaxID=29139 RepID=UPI000FFD2326|nr:coiled-coil domain-containing protein 90B, mitochondrial-like isoform X2 [Vombatus ursinus]